MRIVAYLLLYTYCYCAIFEGLGTNVILFVTKCEFDANAIPIYLHTIISNYKLSSSFAEKCVL